MFILRSRHLIKNAKNQLLSFANYAKMFAHMASFEVVNLPPIILGYIEAEGGVNNAPAAHEELGALLVKKNVGITYGLHYVEGDRYIAGVALRGKATRLKLPQIEVPKGLYAQNKINNWPKRIDKIDPAFAFLEAAITDTDMIVDAKRPHVEVYSHSVYNFGSNELIIRVPILKP